MVVDTPKAYDIPNRIQVQLFLKYKFTEIILLESLPCSSFMSHQMTLQMENFLVNIGV